MPAQSASARKSGGTRKSGNSPVRGALKFLRQAQIHMIDDALIEVGEFGEVRLIVAKGRLRFVVTQRSHDALKWEQQAQTEVRPGDGAPAEGGSS